MSQNAELDKVKAKIRALSAMTVGAGASENEANYAMQMIGKLLTQYNLSMEEVDVAAEACVQVRVGCGTKKRAQHGLFAMSIARFCGTRVWSSKQTTEMSYVFFGLESDVQMAEYLFKIINAAMKTETERFKKTPTYINAEVHRKRLSTSFQNAFGHRVSDRLDEQRYEQEQVRKSRPSDSRGLVVIAKEKRIEEEFKKKSIRLRVLTNYTRSTSNEGAAAGREAGDRVNLSRPVGGSQGNQLRIGRS